MNDCSWLEIGSPWLFRRSRTCQSRPARKESGKGNFVNFKRMLIAHCSLMTMTKQGLIKALTMFKSNNRDYIKLPGQWGQWQHMLRGEHTLAKSLPWREYQLHQLLLQHEQQKNKGQDHRVKHPRKHLWYSGQGSSLKKISASSTVTSTWTTKTQRTWS